MEKRITALLNLSVTGNIYGKQSDACQELVQEYFTASNDDSESDSDSSECESTADEVNKSISITDQDGEFEEPVVRIESNKTACEPMDEDGYPPELLRQAQQFSCRCTQIKVIPNDGEQRSGCIVQFSPDEIVTMQLSVQDLDREAKDMLILGVISACIRMGPTTECSKKKQQAERKKPRSTYFFMGRQLCTTALRKLLCISKDKLQNLLNHYKENGLAPRKLKSGGRKPNTASLTLADTDHVKSFILHYAEDHAVSLPGRVPGFKRDDIKLLPSSHTKSRVYRSYAESVDRAGFRKVAASTFRTLWLQLCPYVVVARPMTDLCWKCQKNNTQIFRSANLTFEQKSELVQEQQAHLSQVDAERQLYKMLVEESKTVAAQFGITRLHQSPRNTIDMAMHYSFDYAQQVHYPSDAAQPGPIYFLTPRKCGIFGVCCEALPQQVNYLVDEAVCVSKGSNSVVSYLHHFFSSYGMGEKSVHLHCDNCAGQNKNRFVLWYFCWRVMKGLHTNVTINFMPPGHTKFAPDWCFGLLKRCFRKSDVHCLDDLCDVVKESTAVSGINIPQLVGHEDGTVEVPTYDWQEFLSPAFKPLQGIKKLHHFRFSATHPGRVFYRESLADVESSFDMTTLRAFQNLPAMPQELQSLGLNQARKQYLFQHIREFVREDKRDVVCPDPGN